MEGIHPVISCQTQFSPISPEPLYLGLVVQSALSKLASESVIADVKAYLVQLNLYISCIYINNIVISVSFIGRLNEQTE